MGLLSSAMIQRYFISFFCPRRQDFWEYLCVLLASIILSIIHPSSSVSRCFAFVVQNVTRTSRWREIRAKCAGQKHSARVLAKRWRLYVIFSYLMKCLTDPCIPNILWSLVAWHFEKLGMLISLLRLASLRKFWSDFFVRIAHWIWRSAGTDLPNMIERTWRQLCGQWRELRRLSRREMPTSTRLGITYSTQFFPSARHFLLWALYLPFFLQ